MALVRVEHLGLDTDGLQGAHATDAEQDLLPQTVLDVTAVQPVGDLTKVVGVLLHVGVEQEQRHAADVRPPHRGAQRPTGDVDLDAHTVDRGQCHRIRVEVGVALLLPAVDRQLLAEVAMAVEQPDAHERARRDRTPP